MARSCPTCGRGCEVGIEFNSIEKANPNLWDVVEALWYGGAYRVGKKVLDILRRDQLENFCICDPRLLLTIDASNEENNEIELKDSTGSTRYFVLRQHDDDFREYERSFADDISGADPTAETARWM